jgi:DNA-binding transcriptional LysR family regulator
MSLNLHLLRLFTAVARHGSFSKAAEALHLSQPAISKGVRDLEDQIGSRLLDRGGPGNVTVTEVGARLLRHAKTLFAAERAAEEELAAYRSLERGTLVIGASTTIAIYLLPAVMGEFHRKYPQIELTLHSANTRDIVDLLGEHELDVALVEGPVQDAGLEVVGWVEDEMICIASPDHPLASSKTPITRTELSREVFLVREPGSGTREAALEILKSGRIAPRRLMEVGSTEAIKQLVAGGAGLAIVSSASAVDQIALGKLVTLPAWQQPVRRALTRLRIRGRQPSAAVAAFEAILDRQTAVARSMASASL